MIIAFAVFALLQPHSALASETEPLDTPPCCHPQSRWAVVAPAAPAAGEAPRVAVERSAAGARVTIDGELMTEYLVDTARQPAMWPLIGPLGQRLTRSYPLGERQELEQEDHPHHCSLWFAHGGVRKADGPGDWKDYWHINAQKPSNEQIKHREFTRIETLPGHAVVETENDWMTGESRLLADRRTLAFGVSGEGADTVRWIDATIRLTATDGAVEFQDTKEGSFGVRVAGAMKLDANLGGRVLNSRQQKDAAAWGQPAEWVDYSGPIDSSGTQGGVTILTHPDSFRPVCRWHVRGYGLFAANPFGKAQFPPGEPAQGAVTLADGEALTLRYLIVLHNGDATAKQIDAWRQAYSENGPGLANELSGDKL